MLSSSDLLKLRKHDLSDNRFIKNGLSNTDVINLQKQKVAFGLNTSDISLVTKINSSINNNYTNLGRNYPKYTPNYSSSGLTSSDLLAVRKQSIINNSGKNGLSSSQLLESQKKKIIDINTNTNSNSNSQSDLTDSIAEIKERLFVFKNIEHVVANNIHGQGYFDLEGDMIGKGNINLKTDGSMLTLGLDSDFKITHDGTTGADITGNPINITAGGESTFKTTFGDFLIDSEAGTLTLDGDTGITLQNNSNDISLNSAVDINLTAATDTNITSTTGDIVIDSQAATLTLDGDTGITLQNNSNDISLNSAVDINLTAATDTNITSTTGDITLNSLAGSVAIGNSNSNIVIEDDNTEDSNGNITVSAKGLINFESGDGDFIFKLDDGTENDTVICAIQYVVDDSGNGSTQFSTSIGGDLQSAMTFTSGNVVSNRLFASSDVRWKENIQTISNPLDKIQSLRGVTFNWKNKPNNKKDIGFIAQEVEKILPELVFTESSGYKSVSYQNIVSLLTEGIKSQQYHISQLEKRIHILESKVRNI